MPQASFREVGGGADVGERNGAGHLVRGEGVGGVVLVCGLEGGGFGEGGAVAAGEREDGEGGEQDEDEGAEAHEGIVRERRGEMQGTCKTDRGG